VSVSINLSALDIEQKSTRENILELLEEHKDFAHLIVFELLEDESVKEFKIIRQFITDVKKYGVRIAIDDFGAGYSNYERLLDYQPDILKIDGCLIRDIETSSYSLSVVKSIVTFAKEQNLQTIAEYIENEAIYNIVKDLGVDFSQGYYFDKPEPIAHYINR
jgi:EAL domain-containing protein (putative c-di-GMP-specific phosphodiesterase class I)